MESLELFSEEEREEELELNEIEIVESNNENSQMKTSKIEDTFVREIAIKMYRKKDLQLSTLQRMKKEVEALILCRGNPYVVQFFGLSQDKYFLYFILELCPNGTLVDVLKKQGKLSLSLARFYAAELVLLLEFIHSKGIVHRQLIPEKILLDSHYHIKVGSFSSSIVKGYNLISEDTNYLNRYYCPEQVTQNLTTPSSDLWALGCIIYFMLTGKFLFRKTNEQEIARKVSEAEYTLDEIDDMNAIDLINRLLDVDPKKRLGVGSPHYNDIKLHPFFENIFVSLTASNFQLIPPKEPNTLASICIKFIQKHQRQYWKLDFIWEKYLPIDLLEKIFFSVDNLEEMRKGKKYLSDGEVILKVGLVWKKTFMLRRRYQAKIILTNLPRIIILEQKGKKINIKEEISWIPSESTAKAISPQVFCIRTKKKLLHFDLVSCNASDWVDLIIDIKKKSCLVIIG